MNSFKYKIGFIGAGRVGFSLGKYFVQKGLNVTGYYSRDINHSKEASDFTNTRCYESIDNLISDSDVIFVTVSDSAIEIMYN